MTTRVVDYSPLLATPAPRDVAAYRAQAREAGARWARTPVRTILLVAGVAIAGALVLIPVVGGILLFVAEGLNSGSPVAVVFLVVFVLGIAVVGVAIVRVAISGGGRWGRWLRMDRFARANGFVFSPADANPGYPGSIFGLGDSREAIEHFRTVEGPFLDFGNYRYATGSGRSRTTHTRGFLTLRLDMTRPHPVLASRADDGVVGDPDLPADALDVFPPDLGALLVDDVAPFDVEIVDDWMFVYSNTPFPAAEPAVYQRLLRIVETVGATTLGPTDRDRDDRAEAPFAADVVAPRGTRLTRGVTVGAIVMIAVAALIWGWSFVSDVLEGFPAG